jgi:hypoxanthine phosphoribosyltransferase
MEKRHFTYEEIHRTVAALAREILADGYDPDLMVAIGTGGFIPARILKTFLKRPILAVGVKLYDEEDRMGERPRKVQWIGEEEASLRGKRVLLVDEVDDSRTTLAFCAQELLRHCPEEVAVAVLHCKDKPKRAPLPPEVRRYWAGEHLGDPWIVYPWDALDIDAHGALAQA